MFFRHAHIYLKIRINKTWVKHLENQTVAELHAHEHFTTERLLIGNFDVALSVAKAAIKQVDSAGVKWVTPKIVIHPLEYLEGGLSPAEKRLFCELAASTNAFDIRVWEGTELADMQVVKLFKSEAANRF